VGPGRRVLGGAAAAAPIDAVGHGREERERRRFRRSESEARRAENRIGRGDEGGPAGHHHAGGVADSTPYGPMKIARKSGLGWKKGDTVLLLDDAEGNTWVMKGFQLGLKPTKTYEQFVAAGAANFKKLPPGWKFRTRTLDRDPNERPEGGVATIMPDEFFNVYDKTGPGMSNYKP
jgi:hypothetical protein